MVVDSVGMFFNIILVLEKNVKSQVVDQKRNFEFSTPPKCDCSSITHFFIIDSQLHLTKKVPMDHTDHFGVQQKIVVT